MDSADGSVACSAQLQPPAFAADFPGKAPPSAPRAMGRDQLLRGRAVFPGSWSAGPASPAAALTAAIVCRANQLCGALLRIPWENSLGWQRRDNPQVTGELFPASHACHGSNSPLAPAARQAPESKRGWERKEPAAPPLPLPAALGARLSGGCQKMYRMAGSPGRALHCRQLRAPLSALGMGDPFPRLKGGHRDPSMRQPARGVSERARMAWWSRAEGGKRPPCPPGPKAG